MNKVKSIFRRFYRWVLYDFLDHDSEENPRWQEKHDIGIAVIRYLVIEPNVQTFGQADGCTEHKLTFRGYLHDWGSNWRMRIKDAEDLAHSYMRDNVWIKNDANGRRFNRSRIQSYKIERIPWIVSYNEYKELDD